MRARMGASQQEAAAAEIIWQDHFRVLNQDNVYARIVQYKSAQEDLNRRFIIQIQPKIGSLGR